MGHAPTLWDELAARQAPSLANSNPNFLYAGTEVGLYASEDSGATWSPTNKGPTNCSVDDLFWMGETLTP